VWLGCSGSTPTTTGRCPSGLVTSPPMDREKTRRRTASTVFPEPLGRPPENGCEKRSERSLPHDGIALWLPLDGNNKRAASASRRKRPTPCIKAASNNRICTCAPDAWAVPLSPDRKAELGFRDREPQNQGSCFTDLHIYLLAIVLPVSSPALSRLLRKSVDSGNPAARIPPRRFTGAAVRPIGPGTAALAFKIYPAGVSRGGSRCDAETERHSEPLSYLRGARQEKPAEEEGRCGEPRCPWRNWHGRTARLR